MSKGKDLTGLIFGNLTVIEFAGTRKTHKQWLCDCKCGNQTIVFQTNLLKGNTTSCGCLSSRNQAHKLKDINTKHGQSQTKLYHVYYAMLDRCFNVDSKAYEHYGNRGISMCENWKSSFEHFYEWAVNNGYREGLTLDRINNNDDYKPSNCQWITQAEQSLNKRTTLYATINGETKTLKEWSDISGVKYKTLRARYVDYGWTGEKLLSKPHTRGD